MYDINALTVADGKVWAATSGGVFSYSPQSDSFTQITSGRGALSNLVATAIAVDNGGNVLVGEVNGSIDELSQSGTVDTSQHDITNSSFLSDTVVSMTVSGDTLYACTPFGVVVISLANFQTLDTYLHFVPGQSSLKANGVATFDGNIYVANQFGLSYAPLSALNLAAPTSWDIADSGGLSSGVNVVKVFNGALYAGTPQGLFMSTDGVTFQQVASFSSPVNGLTPGQNSLLVNSTAGIYELDQNLPTKQIYIGAQLNDVAQYSDTLIYGATSSGLLSIGSTVSTILPPGPATNSIASLAVDGNGNLWCVPGYHFQGNTTFMEFNGTTWKNYTWSSIGVPQSQYNYFSASAVCGDKVILGSWGSGLAMFHGDSLSILNHSNSGLTGVQENPSFILVGGAACDANGDIWITDPRAYNGNVLNVLTPGGTWYSFNYGNSTGPSSGGFNTIAIDALGGVWSGDGQGDEQGSYHGLMYYNPGGSLTNSANAQGFLETAENSPLLSDQVTDVIVDAEQNVWVGTALGMDEVYYDPSSPGQISIIYVYPLLNQFINGIDYDAVDHKWVATNAGVFEMSTSADSIIAQYNTTSDPPLPSNQVLAVACDRAHGIVYFATPDGITDFNIGVVQPVQSFSKLKIFPDPAKIPLPSPIQIQGLVANSDIKIFTVSGRLVKQFQAQGGSIAYWNGTDQSGNLLPSGVYIIVAYSSDGSQSTVSKIALIRQ
ncbi:MAG: hypothetical protein M1339_04745 [Bacteroidetes bacterium]|nr:hypothetical protein [Bacteroidota bacterium]